MARQPRIAAHLGRPETPEEERARKAENSRNYRQSKTFTNLIFALVITLAIVAAVYFIVPRGDLERAPRPDVAAIASDISSQVGSPALVPDVPDNWGINVAKLEPGSPGVWTINYNDIPGDDRAFLKLAQAFDAGDAWAAHVLAGSAPTGTVTIDGIEWTEYEISNADEARNVSYALGVQAGAAHVLIYGTAEPDTAAVVATALAADIRTLQEEVDR